MSLHTSHTFRCNILTVCKGAFGDDLLSNIDESDWCISSSFVMRGLSPGI